MTTTGKLTNILLIGAIGILLLVTLGGKTFEKIVATSHFLNDHPECKASKMDAIRPDSFLKWETTPRGTCAFYHDVSRNCWIVIILVVSRGVVTLITGYDIANPGSWLKRPSNH